MDKHLFKLQLDSMIAKSLINSWIGRSTSRGKIKKAKLSYLQHYAIKLIRILLKDSFSISISMSVLITMAAI